MGNTIREATFAGRFYPGKAIELEELIEQQLQNELVCIKNKLAKNKIIGGIVPHAGYIYSGYQAVHFYEILKESEQQFSTIVIINPNHTGFGSGYFNLCGYQQWETPFGAISIDQEFSKELEIAADKAAHMNEHAGEVQLPLLQYFLSYSFQLVMITMNFQSVETAKLLAAKLHRAAQITEKKVLVIASTDFSHFETPETGNAKDQLVFDQILDRNTAEIALRVKQNKISVCGFGTIMTLIEYAKLTTPDFQMELLKKGNSGDVHPSNKVVGYASFLCFEPRRTHFF